MNRCTLIFSTGFALFSMFFGSGNLVFPLSVGYESGGSYLLASLGIILTGVIVPFLGAYGMMLCQGDIGTFFKPFGKKGSFLFILLALSLLGPFGVIARCLTVAHAAMLLLIPNATLPVSSLLLCFIIYCLAYNQNRLISLIGSLLTPFLLLSIAAIVYFGITAGNSPDYTITTTSALNAFKTGFFQGYQTMDLLAAFFFSQFVIRHLVTNTSDTSNKDDALKIFSYASLIGALLLSLVYFALVLLGSIYAPILASTPPEEMLGAIAMASLGPFAAPIVAVAIIFACLTTAIILTALFAQFLRTDLCGEKISPRLSISITLIIAFLISTLEFSTIAKFLSPLLENIYPILILLTLVNIVIFKFKMHKSQETSQF